MATSNIMNKIGFIGTGTVGTALATILHQRGYPVIAVSDINRDAAERLSQNITDCRVMDNNQSVADTAELIFITTTDNAIPSVVAEVQWHSGQNVIHCSGADSTDILEPARQQGALVGTFHPLQTLASVEQAMENIPGSTFTIEAEETLRTTLKEMAAALNGKWIELKASDKVLYHAAAVIACNYLVTLIKLATDLWQTFNVPAQQATRAMMPLLQGTLRNIDSVGIPQCLTGPIARGDSGTINKHIKALQQSAPEVLSAYRELGLQTIPISLAKGKISEQQAAELRQILQHSAN